VNRPVDPWTAPRQPAIRGMMAHPSASHLDELTAGLNEPQREAVLHTDGPLLVLAGPGSGKTRVITRRAAYIASTVARPSEVLAITFTNKAAREMRERIDRLEVGRGMWVYTFHALCARLLRQYADVIGVPRNFTIFDRDDRRKLIKNAIELCGLSDANWTPARIDPIISRAKNALQTADDFARAADDWSLKQVAKVYTGYESLTQEMGGLDFDDLLLRVALGLERLPEWAEELENRFRYVLIDEYQDTNAAQYKIARYLARQRENICATGDPDQSVYGWRGADIGNILSFERDYPSAKVVRLEQNYRSTKRILAVADALISGNRRRKAKRLWTENAEGTSIQVVECGTGDAEAEFVAQEIARRVRHGESPREIAVFYRVNSLSRAIEEALLRAGVRYQVARGVEFYNRKEIKDVLAYLRVLVNPADEVALLRIINTPPRGIGDTTVERLGQMGEQNGQRLYDLLMSGADFSAIGRAALKVRQFADLLRKLSEALDQPAPQALDFVVSQSGLRAFYKDADDAEGTPLDNIDELITAAAEFHQTRPEATIIDWLEHTALLSDVDSVRDENGVVTLMTLHAAKGLEFSVVYMIGLEEGLLPFRREGDEGATDEEEERRLCFVGITRAKEQLTLAFARYRMHRGITERTVRSPFLDELPDDQLEWLEHGIEKRSGKPYRERLPDDAEEWSVGTLVRHPLHGLGQVMGLTRLSRRTHVDVQFRDGSRRNLILEFAPLKRVAFDEVE